MSSIWERKLFTRYKRDILFFWLFRGKIDWSWKPQDHKLISPWQTRTFKPCVRTERVPCHIVLNSFWIKKNRASDNEGKFHTYLKCRIWICNKKINSSLDIRVSVNLAFFEKIGLFTRVLEKSQKLSNFLKNLPNLC